ncbi:DENN domain-containing protein 5A-like protein [Sarcoptes scabiei]|uniref:DENN domain-containing protein 5A-like protein n=1 Tax=Sarcoptes scabiei TaxID=52283 RepID=A0A132A916_SARSC|nr:DENN domain-containing protein 5A-like protein [Sarcoptes scabiei]
MFSQITILDGTIDGKINISLKIEDCPFVDDNSLALLAMPDGPFMKTDPIEQTFHPFVITVQNGQRIYGGSLIFGLKQLAKTNADIMSDEHRTVYISRALVAVTIRPLVNQLKKLLEWCVKGGCNPRWLRCLVNIRLPPKGKFIIINLPEIKSLNMVLDQKSTNNSANITKVIEMKEEKMKTIGKVFIFRPLNIFSLFDYSFRHLFSNVITLDEFLLLFSCALNEQQVLICSDSYYNLMLISESLITLLNPFKWQHVYVPILPTKLGLHYLEAPTPFIMGINSRLRNFIKPSKIACWFDCDDKKLKLNIDPNSFIFPPFIEELRNDLNTLFASETDCGSLSQNDSLEQVSKLVQQYKFFDQNDDDDRLQQEQNSSLSEIKLNQMVRVFFYNCLSKYILNKYQQYIIVGLSKEQIKFDSVSYLSDQPQSMRSFLQNFSETQMFTSFIDEAGKNILKRQKIESANEPSLYDNFLIDDNHYDQTDSVDHWQSLIEARFNNAQIINLVELEDSAKSQTVAIPSSPFKKKVQIVTPLKNSFQSKIQVNGSPCKHQSPSIMTAPTNWKVVETLLKEVKIKTKRILLAKMGTDEIGTLKNSSPQVSQEDNILITALCDLIERIWSHARSFDYDENTSNSVASANKCLFWSHLKAYFESSRNEINNNSIQIKDMINSPNQEDQNQSSSWISLKKRIDSLSQLSLDHNSSNSRASLSTSLIFKSIPTTLFYDYKSIDEMKEIKTDIGKSRAFIRLSIERKLLSKHLRTLLYNQDLLQSLYKRYAFLRCEDEREQFLTHLLTLNAVDLNCFTYTFTTSELPYSFVIVSPSNFQGHVSINGSSNQTVDPILIDSNHIQFKHKNFGHIFTLSITIKIGQKIFIDRCILRNDVTNGLYKFECNKWLGKNMDDGSIERLLLGELVQGSINDHIKQSSYKRSSSIGRNWSRSTNNNSPDTFSKDDKLSVEDLKCMLSESINHIMKFCFNEKIRNKMNEIPRNQKTVVLDNSDKSGEKFQSNYSNSTSAISKLARQKSFQPHTNINIFSLLFGQNKFLWILMQIFYYGFRNHRSFRRRTFLWDYLLRVQCELKLMIAALNTGNEDVRKSDRNEIFSFINLIDSITDKADTYGKDLKFELFLLISLRDHKLIPFYFKLMLRPHLLQTHYEQESFLRNPPSITFFAQ